VAAEIGGKVNAVMREVERHNPQLAGLLPKTFNPFTTTPLKKISEVPATLIKRFNNSF
jgi:type I restriction enzyme M protein